MGRSGKRRRVGSPVDEASEAIVDPNTGVLITEFDHSRPEDVADAQNSGSGLTKSKKRKRKKNTHEMLESDTMNWKEFDVDNTVMMDFASQGRLHPAYIPEA